MFTDSKEDLYLLKLHNNNKIKIIFKDLSIIHNNYSSFLAEFTESAAKPRFCII